MTIAYFNQSMPGAPAMTAASLGSLISVLDAVLVNGINSKTLSSCVVVSEVAVATVAAGHELSMLGRLCPRILLDGSTDGAIDGVTTAISLDSGTQFTFPAPGVPDGVMGGTITVRLAPAGWTILYTGTNKRVYQSPTNDKVSLRVEETATQAYSNRCTGVVNPLSIDDRSSEFPSAALETYFNIFKSTSWEFFGDESRFLIVVNKVPYFFGAIDALSDVDESAILVSMAKANTEGTTSAIMCPLTASSSHGSMYFYRNSTQQGALSRGFMACGSVEAATRPVGCFTGSAKLSYPNYANGGMYVEGPALYGDESGSARGTLPFYWPLHDNPFSVGPGNMSGAGSLADKDFKTLPLYCSGYSSKYYGAMMVQLNDWS